jgi:hypothetical protein
MFRNTMRVLTLGLVLGVVLVALTGQRVAHAAPATSPSYINGMNVGYPQNSFHAWGPCLVQDFNGGPYGWVIVSYTSGVNIVRGGMLLGWIDDGGAPRMGCPVNQEHGYLNGVRQDFQHGSLYWAPGMGHATRIDGGVQGAPTYINSMNVGYPQNGPHWWGSCIVQDFNGGSYGWVIASYTSGTNIVRGGMLSGWLDNGGAPGALGCPINQEHGYLNGVRQDFQHGSLYWFNGMSHAVRIDFSREGAVAWAYHCIPDGTCYYSGSVRNYAYYCLAFVVDAYQNGQNWRLTGGPTGPNSAAYQWWYSRSAADQHPHDTNPPRGALVFWDRWVASDGSGHVAISLGNGYAISTEFGGNPYVHVIHIADYPYQYLGWVAPK